MTAQLEKKIEDLEAHINTRIDRVDEKFTGALIKISESLEKLAVISQKTDALEHQIQKVESKTDKLQDQYHQLDKAIGITAEAAKSVDESTKEVKEAVKKLLERFVAAFFVILIFGVLGGVAFRIAGS